MEVLNDLFDQYLKYVKKYKKPGTYHWYNKCFISLKKAIGFIGVRCDTDIDSELFENLTDYYLNHTTKKHSKINDVLSSLITVLNFYSIEYPKRYILIIDTLSFKAINF